MSCTARTGTTTGRISSGKRGCGVVQTISSDDIRRLKGRGYLYNRGTATFSSRIVTVNGRLSAAQMRLLADLASRFGTGAVTLTTRQNFELPGIPFGKIAAFEGALAAGGLSVGGTGPRVRPVVSCKGTTCPCGLIDTFALAQAIHERFYLGWHDVTLPGKFKIAVGGCPNNCVKPDLNDLGIVGKVLPGGTRGYQITLGGHWGRTGAAGSPVAVLATETEVLEYVEKILVFYRDQGKPGERLFKTLARLGTFPDGANRQP